jgi:glycine/serine hydroxymethyltransferase
MLKTGLTLEWSKHVAHQADFKSSGTLRYMISYMISEDNDIDYDIIGFEMSMIS